MKKIAAAASLLAIASTSYADGLSRPDSHGPIGVMGEHTHSKGEWMLSYRYMDMEMDGNRSGTNRVSTQDVLSSFMVAPLEMSMKMHMLGGMYAPSDKLTLMAMIPVVEFEMDHINRGGVDFTTESSGIGDIKIGGLYNISQNNGSNLIANFTLSLPTGSIDEKDQIPGMMGDQQLPYPMQIGSGTYDLIPGITYTQLQDSYSWGAQAKATIRLSDNDNNYTLGDRYMLTAWTAKPVTEHISISARLSHDDWKDIDGADNQLNPMMVNALNGNGTVATLRPDLRAGNRTDLGLGVNLIFGGEGVANHRIALEISQPVAQDLDGPQLETDKILTLGYQVAL